MYNKQFYETPEAELILVRFEENFLDSDNQRSLNYSDTGGAGTITNHRNYNEDAF